jgi:hypothetical protein
MLGKVGKRQRVLGIVPDSIMVVIGKTKERLEFNKRSGGRPISDHVQFVSSKSDTLQEYNETKKIDSSLIKKAFFKFTEEMV